MTPTLLALTAVALVKLLHNYYGAFAINFFGRGIVVDGLLWPVVFAGAMWAAAVTVRSRRARAAVLLAPLLAAGAMWVYNEITFDTGAPVTNTACESDTASGWCRDCNVVLISIDTLRADHLGCYGYGRQTSPSIDALASESVLFEKTYSAAPATLISHTTMFTGLNPGAHTAQCMTHLPAPDSARMLPETLKLEGYLTAGITGGAQISRFFGFSQGFDIYDDSGGGFAAIWPRARIWLTTKPAGPFFLFLHSYDVHHPYDPPPPYNSMFFPAYHGDLPDSISIDLIKSINDGATQVSGEDVKHIEAVYDGGIRYTDNYIGKILAFLQVIGELDRTIVILTSDHGEEFGEHGSVGTHAISLYNELIQVPLIMRIPGVRPGRVTRRVGLVDLAPTLYELLGIEAPAGSFQGVSFAPMLWNESCAGAPRTMTAEKEYPPGEAYGRMKSVRDGRWRLITRTTTPRSRTLWRFLGGLIYPIDGKELFDVKADPRELHNLAGRYIQRTRIMDTMSQRAAAWNERYRLKPNPEKFHISREELERMKNLGYIK